MSEHLALLSQYLRLRDVRFRLNNHLVTLIPKESYDVCGKALGISKKGVLYFETEDELSLLADYCIYTPGSDGRNVVERYLAESPPPAESDEMTVLRAMTHAYYTLFRVIGVERGVGVAVRDLFRGEDGFIVDVGFGSSANIGAMLATRVIPADGYLATGGAALPVDPKAAVRIADELAERGYDPAEFDYKQITPRQEAEVAAIVIRECRSTGMSSRIRYAEPQAQIPPLPTRAGRPRIGRNDKCPCGSGKKFKTCCGRR